MAHPANLKKEDGTIQKVQITGRTIYNGQHQKMKVKGIMNSIGDEFAHLGLLAGMLEEELHLKGNDHIGKIFERSWTKIHGLIRSP